MIIPKLVLLRKATLLSKKIIKIVNTGDKKLKKKQSIDNGKIIILIKGT